MLLGARASVSPLSSLWLEVENVSIAFCCNFAEKSLAPTLRLIPRLVRGKSSRGEAFSDTCTSIFTPVPPLGTNDIFC